LKDEGLEKYRRISKVQNEEMKKEKMTQKEKKNGWKTRTPRTVLILREGGCNVSPCIP